MTTYSIDIYYTLNKKTDLNDMDYLLNTHAKKYGGILTNSDVGPYGTCCCIPVIWRINSYFVPAENITEFKEKLPRNYFIENCSLLEETKERSSYMSNKKWL